MLYREDIVVRKMMPIIVEDTDPPFGPIAIMKYSDDGLYVPEADCAKLEIRYNALKR